MCVFVCAHGRQCVDICDTLSQQMYVISFRRDREGERERPRERKKAVGFSGFGDSWITVVNFEMDATLRGG